MKRLLWLLLIAAAWAQTNGFAPTVIHSNSHSAQNVALWDTLTSGKTLIAWATWDGSGITVTLTDAQGNTFGHTSPCSFTDGIGTVVNSEIWYTTVGSTGTDTFTFAGLSGATSHWATGYGQFDNISATPDGAGVCTTTLVQAASLTSSFTTSVNGDLLINVAAGGAADSILYAKSSDQVFGGTAATMAASANWRVAGQAGAQSTTFFSNQFHNPDPGWNISTLAFKPAAISVTTSALADGASGAPYQSTLTAVGGSGAYTWSNTAGSWPTGCSAASISSAGVISCTPSSTGTFTLTFQVTDGTNTTSRVLTWIVGGGFLNPTFVASSSGYSTNTGTTKTVYATVPSACPGDIMVISVSDFVGGAAGGGVAIPPTSGSGNFWTSTCQGTTFHRIDPASGVPAGNGLGTYIASISSSCVSPEFGYVIDNTSPQPGGLMFSLAQMRGVQPVVDPGTETNQSGFNTLAISQTTPNLATQVSNELLYSVGVSANSNDASTNVVAISPPFTTIINYFCLFALECQVAADDQVTTASTYTSTATQNTTVGDNTGNTLAVNLIGLRPASSVPAGCVLGPIGDKQRRVPW